MIKQEATKRKWMFIVALFVVALLIKFASFNSGFVERYYSTGLYIFISNTLRILFGWLPFSIGDVLYAIVAVWLLIKLVRFIKRLFTKQLRKQLFFASLRKLAGLVLIVYILFNVLWGLNYNRKGIAYQLKLQPQKETKEDLFLLTRFLLQKVNSGRRSLPQQVHYLSPEQTFSEATTAYKNAERQYPFLRYQNSSIKSSFYGLPGNYLGFSGYYNPFTAEAQVNTKMISFLMPYTTCHEMAHQLGYASEDEANFVGYLAAKSSPDMQFQYSVYFDLFNYANSELFVFDSTAAKNNYKQLDTLVKQDIKAYRLFLQRYENPLEPIITILYGNYLKANNQPEGIKTYSLVTAWLIDYRKKYGDL